MCGGWRRPCGAWPRHPSAPSHSLSEPWRSLYLAAAAGAPLRCVRVEVGFFNCQQSNEHQQFCQEKGVNHYPTVLAFPRWKARPNPILNPNLDHPPHDRGRTGGQREGASC